MLLVDLTVKIQVFRKYYKYYNNNGVDPNPWIRVQGYVNNFERKNLK